MKEIKVFIASHKEYRMPNTKEYLFILRGWVITV